MKLLFDNNLSTRLPQIVGDIFADSDHVYRLGLSECSDRQVFDFARKNQFTIVTKDTLLAVLQKLSG